MIACADDLSAQSTGNTNLLLYALLVVAAILLIGVIMQVADNLLRVEASKHNLQTEGLDLWGGLGVLFAPKLPDPLKDQDVYILKAGYDIKLEGEAAHEIHDTVHVTRYAMQPQNFTDMSPIPKVLLETGNTVKAGQPLFIDKKRPDVQYVAPVSGEILEIRRGAKRAITEVVILADRQLQYLEHHVPDMSQISRESLVEFLLQTGAWTLIRQRPYNLVPDPHVIPVHIFISTFDSAPLAPDANFIMQGKGEDFQMGLDVLGKLTSGKVHLGLDGRGDANPSAIFTEASGVEKHWFRGPHPSGNVGVQIHHVTPMKPGQKVWTLGIQEVAAIGRLFITGQLDGSRIVAITGSPVRKPTYVRTYVGAHIGELNKDNLDGDNLRYISGDVLSGEQKSQDSYLNFHDDQLTVLKEGNEYEMFGWLLPLTERPSVSRTFPNFLFPDSRFIANTNTHGEKRAFVMTGQYEEMLPMKIYPQHLMKAILANDLEKMEGLGIYELSEEDIALCEFACTSKMPLQQILKDGQKVMREQT
ncbi:MAG TPA: Na(+)-translocating NADH-quinone reductase subunit A [Saprospiraceae bacterium]|nr:Na(+)-translocating NADH-quinone reductase subunit A [Saprospiraceae bacterium]